MSIRSDYETKKEAVLSMSGTSPDRPIKDNLRSYIEETKIQIDRYENLTSSLERLLDVMGIRNQAAEKGPECDDPTHVKELIKVNCNRLRLCNNQLGELLDIFESELQ